MPLDLAVALAFATLEKAPLVDGAAPLPPTVRDFGLTRREREVLRLLAQGRSYQEIADELFITRKTVAKHFEHIFNRLGVNSRAAAAAIAFQHGLA